MKRQPSEWEKIIAIKGTDKGRSSPKYINSSYNSISEKQKKSNQKMGRRSKHTFLQIRYTDG